MKRILFFVAPLCIALALYGFATTTVNTDSYNRNVYSYEGSDAKIYLVSTIHRISNRINKLEPIILVTLLTIFVVTAVARLMIEVAELNEIKKSNNKGKDI
ncbi:MAG: hypothetical protein IT544_03925 [Rhodobacteraceae bacterium]|nr:hypothetical protein [Paracoccaceae bacterium]